MGLLYAAAALLLGYSVAYVASDDVRYISRAGIEETRILMGRVPITQLAQDPATPDSLRAMAGLVVAVREHARLLGLEAGETYTTYSDVGRDTLLLVLTASPKRCLCPVTWSFPIVGRIPYKGFFDQEKAQAAAAQFLARDYDVHLRPSGAFSTLGWFNDPLLSTALSRDSVELAALVFHEIAHNSLWIKDAVDFNESYAQWMGYRAARDFFLIRGDSALALRAEDRWHDEQVLGNYYDLLMGKLDSLYALDQPTAEMLAGRKVIERWSRDTLAAPFGQSLRTVSPRRLAEREINNAALLGVRLYRTGLDLFDAFEYKQGRDLEIALFTLQELMTDIEGPQAFGRLRNYVFPESSVTVPD
jgi:predicted aminopeptidase